MSSYSPGPWSLSGLFEHGYENEAVVAEGKKYVCRVYRREDGTGPANARLIAAAPGLLEICERILNGNEKLETFVSELRQCVTDAKGLQ